MITLNTVLFANPIRAWLIALAIIAGFFLILLFLKIFALRKLETLTKKTDTKFDDIVVGCLKEIRLFVLFLVAIHTGSQHLELSARATRIFDKTIVAILLLQAGFILSKLMSEWVRFTIKDRNPEDGARTTTMIAFGYVGKFIIWIVICLLILDNLGVNIGTLVAGLGLGGIAVALAVQNILGDLIASLSIVIDKPFVVGDFIMVDTFLGTVEHVGLKTTRLRSLSGEQLILSNNDLLKSRIRNMKRMFERRALLNLSIVYGTPASKLEAIPQILQEIITSQSLTKFERATIKTLGPSSIEYEAVYYVLNPDYGLFAAIHHEINLAILRRLSQEEIEIAYPTQSVIVHNPVKG